MNFQQILLTVCVVLASVHFFMAALNIFRVKYSESWPSTKGIILNSEVSCMGSSTGNTTFRTMIRYRYAVGTEEFICSTLCIGGELVTSERQRVQDRCDKYPVGSEVEVYYNPKNPRKACLEKRSEMTLFLIALGGCLLVLGAGVYLWIELMH